MNLQFKYVRGVRKTNYHLLNYIHNIFTELRIKQKSILFLLPRGMSSTHPLKVISSHPLNAIKTRLNTLKLIQIERCVIFTKHFVV